MYEHLIPGTFDRKDVLATLGGGICEAICAQLCDYYTYLRGIGFQIPYLFIPGSSSIGGKNDCGFLTPSL